VARSFNGSSDTINLGSNDTFLGPAAISLSVWVNPAFTIPAYSAVVSRFDQADTFYYQIFIKSTGKAAWYIRGPSGGPSIDPGSHTISTSTWTHLGLTYDSVNGLQTYVNGVSDGTQSANGALATNYGGTFLTLGEDLNTGGRLFAGNMADFSLWNTPLSAAEFLALASGTRPNKIRPIALRAWLPLDGLVSPEPDLTGNGNNGTLTGTAKVFGPPFAPFTPRWPQFLTPLAPPPLMAQICL
jgi:Concanavalin A-like lectin/glucanases superfamily